MTLEQITALLEQPRPAQLHPDRIELTKAQTWQQQLKHSLLLQSTLPRRVLRNADMPPL